MPRPQLTLGTMMALVALAALAMKLPETFRRFLEGGGSGLLLIAGLCLLHRLVMLPFLLLGGPVERWIVGKAPPDLSSWRRR